MNLLDGIGKLFMVGLPCEVLDDEAKRVLAAIKPGSVILFRRNIKNLEQTTSLIENIADFLGYRPLIAVDQEGGIVTRLTEGFSISPGSMALAVSGSPRAAYRAGRIMGMEMRGAGIDWDLAPVVDINTNIDNPVIGIRSFSEDKDIVIRNASEFIQGLDESGIISCLKHFPGIGRASVDPHLDMPILDIPRDALYDLELAPFTSLSAPSWMPTHIYIPSLQSENVPATVSKEILTAMIREELGYEGVLVADDLAMGGITRLFPIEEAAFRSFEAGMDMVSICSGSDIQIRSYCYLKERIHSSERLQTRFRESAKRIERLIDIAKKNRVLSGSRITENNRLINSRIMGKIAYDSVQVVKNEDHLIPIRGKIDTIFASASQRPLLVEDHERGLPAAVRKAAELLECPLFTFSRDMKEQEQDRLLMRAKGRNNLIFTENAHLSSLLVSYIEKLSQVSKSLILVAMRNPYDADIPGIDNAVCSYGYTRDQQRGVLDLLFDGREDIIL